MDDDAEYPQFWATVVGLSPAVMKTLSGPDIEALCAFWHERTGIDPLVRGVRIASEYKKLKQVTGST